VNLLEVQNTRFSVARLLMIDASAGKIHSAGIVLKDQRACATSASRISFCTTSLPIWRPIFWPTRIENR